MASVASSSSRLWTLVARELWRRARRRLRAGPIYHWRYRGRTPERVLIAPPDLRHRRPADRAGHLFRPFSAVRTPRRDRRQVALPARHRQSAMAEIAARLPLAPPHAGGRHRTRRCQRARAGFRLDRCPWQPHCRCRLGSRRDRAGASLPGCSIRRWFSKARNSRSIAPS